MAHERWGQAKIVFQGALDRPPHDRADYLAALCGEGGTRQPARKEARGFLARGR
jgi:hypothetical protein